MSYDKPETTSALREKANAASYAVSALVYEATCWQARAEEAEEKLADALKKLESFDHCCCCGKDKKHGQLTGICDGCYESHIS